MQGTITNYQVNREHKDRLFRFIFREKDALLSLYNAINDSDYRNTEDLVIYTMEDYVYMGMKNDISFLLDWSLNIFEHQSSYNPNMALRGFLYLAAAYRKYIELNDEDIYGSELIALPIPCCCVFYNGLDEMPDELLLRLTDGMPDENAAEVSCAQFTARMININAGHNADIMGRCPLLCQYAQFIEMLRDARKKEANLLNAVNKTVSTCIQKGILADILRANKAEVTDMLLTEYNEVFHINHEKNLSYRKGQESERANTEWERRRADAAEQRADFAEQRADSAEQRADSAEQRADSAEQQANEAKQDAEHLRLQNSILNYKIRGKSEEEIAALLKVSADIIQEALSSISNDE